MTECLTNMVAVDGISAAVSRNLITVAQAVKIAEAGGGDSIEMGGGGDEMSVSQIESASSSRNFRQGDVHNQR
ncbi:hypothetical protein L2E82_00621 [Cichorium intybus]|uniref:Uncharacterized protein n=1 Tax=Cichorium intybus TaxID=13427 RepID=A0ACB9GY77_CICIN|nr:hypothetical protein L2E82_00621 [Cichorium intybus]